MKSNKILLIAGEVSGDLHAAELLKKMQGKDPSLKFFGIGGENLAALGMDIFYPIEQMAFLGIAEVIRHLPFIHKVHKHLVDWSKENSPDCVILVDYPGFNLKLARSLHNISIPVVYYISPQLWAWGKGRIKKVKKYIDKMIVLFPFEKKYYAAHGIKAEYVGHPLSDKHSGYLPAEFKKVQSGHVKLGLLPGSRKQEVHELLPRMLETARKLFTEKHINQAEVVRVKHLPTEMYNGLLKDSDNFIRLVAKPLNELLPDYDAVLVASGTATLECGYYCVPTVVVYHVNALTYYLGKLLVKLKNIGLINIVAEKEVAVELIQHEFTAARALLEVKKLLSPKENLEKREELKIIREKLGPVGAAQRAAEVVLEFLNNA